MKKGILLSGAVALSLALAACGGGSSELSNQNSSSSGGGSGGGNNTDTIAPVITLNGTKEILLSVGDTYTDAGASVTDNVDTSISVSTSGEVISSIPNIYTIKYSATDTAGNKAVDVFRTVKVARKSSYAVYDGSWLKQCLTVTKAEYPELYNQGSRSIYKRIVVSMADDSGTPKKGFFMRIKAYPSTDCSGDTLFKGHSEAFVSYLGEHTTSTCVGEKVDFDVFDGSYDLDQPHGTDLYGQPEALLAFAKKISFPLYNIVCKNDQGQLLFGKLSNEKNGFTGISARPVEFDVEGFTPN